MADVGQLEQVILNLAVNARDAMPNGGILTIETRHINVSSEDYHATAELESPPPGHYLVLSMTDTGLGIDKTTQAQIFEPFFTTKDVGKGTGLGLSMVYGIIKQHKGFIRVYSEPDKGTVFHIFLPVQDSVAGNDSETNKPTGLPRGQETILLAEDDQAVRRVSAKMLIDLGYRVLVAENGKEALKHLQCYGDTIALLLTDVVMPELDGKQLAEQATRLQPSIKIIFTSGYPEAHLKLRYTWVMDHILLQKPFLLSELAISIRKMLASYTTHPV
jgi:CheY-like chemotaxis protein